MEELLHRAVGENMASIPHEATETPAAAPSVRVEIFDQVYNLRGTDAAYILQLAEYVDSKMRAVASQTTTVDTIRLAVLAALNIADEYHVLLQNKSGTVVDFSKRAKTLAHILDEVLEPTRRAG
jgi:cell division protein ZapA